MSRPVEIDLPHQLGRAGAKQRIEGGFDEALLRSLLRPVQP